MKLSKLSSLIPACLAALVLLPASALSTSQTLQQAPSSRPLPNTLPTEEFPEGWQTYDQGLAQAKAQHKFVLIQFFRPGCQPCQQLGADVIAEPLLDDVIRQRFVLIRVNQTSNRPLHYRGRKLSEKQLADQHQIKQYPTLIFLGPDGRLIGRKLGYGSAAELSDVLSYLSTGAYSKMAFNAFKSGQSIPKGSN